MTPAAIRAWLASLPDPEAKAALARFDALERVVEAAALDRDARDLQIDESRRASMEADRTRMRVAKTGLGVREAVAALDALTKEGRG